MEPLAVAYHAVRLAGTRPDHTAVVFGAGPIGLVTTAALRAVGVEDVIVVEPADVRKEKATVAGAGHVLDPRSTDVTAEIMELTKGRGADITFECAGVDAVLKTAIQSTRVGGTCVNVAIWGHEASVAMNDLVFREVNVLGSLAYADDHRPTIDLIARQHLDARRRGGRIRLRGASVDLELLIQLAGLAEVLRVEPRRQPEQREEPVGVEEERQLPDLPV